MSIKLHQAMLTPEGDGVSVKRLMPVHGLRNFDPFVLWDHFDIAGGGFPPHPHRGFEAITYLFAGGMQHKDNLGNEGIIHGGGAQRFTAGSGIVHSEMPDGHAAGIQLWINLPKHLKGLDPAYQQAERGDITSETTNGIRVAHIVGEKGVISLHTGVEYLDIRMPANAQLQRSIPSGWRGIIYVAEGSVGMPHAERDMEVHAAQALIVEDETRLSIQATADAQILWCFGQPHHEPIHQHGPFVD
ncbi:MAG: pirin family protein [Mariprofundaceae bacterium]